MPEQTDNPVSQRGRGGPPAGTPAIVDVVASSMPDGSIGFSHEWRWQDGTPGGKASIAVPSRDPAEPGTPIHFHLTDDTLPKRGLSFTDDVEGAIWVLRDSCPPEHQKCEDTEIPAKRIVRTPLLLKIFNENSEACTLHYRLRFKDRDGKAESYDPDITNGGTNRA